MNHILNGDRLRTRACTILIATGHINGCYGVWVLFVEEQCADVQDTVFSEFNQEVYAN